MDCSRHGLGQWCPAIRFWTARAYAVTSVTDTEVEMASAICPLSHLSITRLISLISETTWTIAHSVTNYGEETRPTGIWSVMMLDTPAAIGNCDGNRYI